MDQLEQIIPLWDRGEETEEDTMHPQLPPAVAAAEASSVQLLLSLITLA